MGHRKELAYVYAIVTEPGLLATHGASSWNFCKASELLQTTQSPRMVTASPQLTVTWSQGQSTLHCNVATQLQCSDSLSVKILMLQLSNTLIMPNN